MFHPRLMLGLQHEALEQIGIVPPQELQGHRPFQTGIPGPEHPPHAAFCHETQVPVLAPGRQGKRLENLTARAIPALADAGQAVPDALDDVEPRGGIARLRGRHGRGTRRTGLGAEPLQDRHVFVIQRPQLQQVGHGTFRMSRRRLEQRRIHQPPQQGMGCDLGLEFEVHPSIRHGSFTGTPPPQEVGKERHFRVDPGCSGGPSCPGRTTGKEVSMGQRYVIDEPPSRRG
jgi:hypothetical protein